MASILDGLVDMHAKSNIRFLVLNIAHCLKNQDSKIHSVARVIYILSNAVILQSLRFFLYICTLKLSLEFHVEILVFSLKKKKKY